MDHTFLTDHSASTTAGCRTESDRCSCAAVAVANRSAKLSVSPLPKMSHLLLAAHGRLVLLDSPLLWCHLWAGVHVAARRECFPQSEMNKEREAVKTDEFLSFCQWVGVLIQRSLVHVLFFSYICGFFLVRTLGLLPHYSVYKEMHTFTLTTRRSKTSATA